MLDHTQTKRSERWSPWIGIALSLTFIVGVVLFGFWLQGLGGSKTTSVHRPHAEICDTVRGASNEALFGVGVGVQLATGDYQTSQAVLAKLNACDS